MNTQKDQQAHKDPHEESLKEIIKELQTLLDQDLLHTLQGGVIINEVIVNLSLLKYSGDSDTDDFTFIDHFHHLLRETLLTIIDFTNQSN